MRDVLDSVSENVEEPYTCGAPYNPHMLNSDERLLQYFTKNWPVKRHATPRKMADVGFYYLNDSDKVICFVLCWRPKELGTER